MTWSVSASGSPKTVVEELKRLPARPEGLADGEATIRLYAIDFLVDALRRQPADATVSVSAHGAQSSGVFTASVAIS